LPTVLRDRPVVCDYRYLLLPKTPAEVEAFREATEPKPIDDTIEGEDEGEQAPAQDEQEQEEQDDSTDAV
jgi:hypothetical protein